MSMTVENIKKMNLQARDSARKALGAVGAEAGGSARASVKADGTRAAGGIEAKGSVTVDFDKQHLLALLVAAAVGVVVYLLLRNYKPAFVTRQVADKVEFDQTRGIISAVIAALVVMLAYYLYTKQ